MNYKHWLVYAVNKLSYKKGSKRDAEILLQYVTGNTRTFIMALDETELTSNQQKKLEHLLNRRAIGEPIAYLVEEKEFWSLSIKVLPISLIPRSDTECLVEKALQLSSGKQWRKILDLGTGTGAIAIALASEYPEANVVGVDINDDIISLAKFNASNLSINNVKFYKSNWFSLIPIQKFDIVISNPPYIDKSDPHLQEGDLRFEPKIALISPNNGLAYSQLIIEQSCNYLSNNGWLLLEHGCSQGKFIRELFLSHFYKNIVTFQDYSGNDRITVGQW
ncbi:MAG: peptide chain release factor N(5)-glutamine methyltransferase [Arsenophonus sp.]